MTTAEQWEQAGDLIAALAAVGVIALLLTVCMLFANLLYLAIEGVLWWRRKSKAKRRAK